VAEKTKTKSWSTKKIKTELLKRGVESKLIDEMLKGKQGDSEIENAMKLAKKKYDQLIKKKLEAKELRNKLSAFLFSKGFEYDLIKDVCRKLLKDENNEF
jgi:regulatory protein